ncbi:unnamed protein product [Paramecium primaurelia]|uniref:Uncharacterized protein n=1 Tax=Paramecium primaurelia TaxID=5886 RepID=A0A8S1QJR5_PARPR|nr:unnamed protein product [Paramecium primaurelia]
MSLTFINLEDSPDKPKPFGLASGMIEDFLHNPLEMLRTLKCDKISGSWDLEKIREILNKINDLAFQNNVSHDIIKPRKISLENQKLIDQVDDFDKLYSSFRHSQKYDNKSERIQKVIKDFKNRVIYRSVRPSSVQPKTIEQPKKCKLMSKEFEQKLNNINEKYGMKGSQMTVKSKYMNHYSLNTNNQQTNTECIRPQTTTCSARKTYSFRREKTFDLDQKFQHNIRTSRLRAQSGHQVQNFELEKQNQSIIARIMKKSEVRLHQKVNLKKYDLENHDIQPTFMLDDSDSQTKRLMRCIDFNPLNSIQQEYRNFMPNDEDFIVKLSFQQIQSKEKRQNKQKQKVFYAKAQSNYIQDPI